MIPPLVLRAKFTQGTYVVRHAGKTASSTQDASSAARRLYAKLHGWDATEAARVTVARVGQGNDYDVTIQAVA